MYMNAAIQKISNERQSWNAANNNVQQNKIGKPGNGFIQYKQHPPYGTEVIQCEYDLKDNSTKNKAKMTDLDTAMTDIDIVLRARNIDYKLQGSMAQAMHGGAIISIPGDLDVLVRSPKIAAQKLVSSGRFSMTVDSPIVAKVKHNTTNVQVDLAQMEDFGMTSAGVQNINGISVIDVYETLLGLFLRHEVRPKDQFSIISLIVQRGDELTQDQKYNIANKAHAPSWDFLYDSALEEYKNILMS